MGMTNAELLARLAEVRKLEAELSSRLSGMSDEEKMKALAEAQPKLKPKSKELASLLAVGYGMSIETARQIKKERETDPQLWPFDKYENALAMIAAYEGKPTVTAKREGWKRVKG